MAPAGACALVSALCLLFVWLAAGPSGQPLARKYGPQGTCSARNPRLVQFMQQAARNVAHPQACVLQSRRIGHQIGAAAMPPASNLASWQMVGAVQGHDDPLLPQSSDFGSFVEEVKDSLERHHLPLRPIDYLFEAASLPRGSNVDPVHPSCAGDYMVRACLQQA